MVRESAVESTADGLRKGRRCNVGVTTYNKIQFITNMKLHVTAVGCHPLMVFYNKGIQVQHAIRVLELYSILSHSGWNHWSDHPARRVAATISLIRQGVKGIRTCEIGLTYDSE
jgi:hypothetical protein